MKFGFLICLSLSLCCGCHYPTTPPPATGIDSSLSTGARVVWRVPRIGHSNIAVQPILNSGRLYLQDDTVARCLDATTGNTIWNGSLRQGWSSQHDISAQAENIIFDNDRLIIVTEYRVVCLDSQTGNMVWAVMSPASTPAGFSEPFYNSTGASSDAIFVSSFNLGSVYKISKSSGGFLWQSDSGLSQSPIYYQSNPTANWTRCPTYSNGRVFVAGRYASSVFSANAIAHDGSVACFDAQTGALLWIKVIPPMDTQYSPYATNDFSTNEFVDQEAFANIVIVNDTLMLRTGNSLTWMDRDGNILYRCGGPDQHGLSMGPWQVRYSSARLIALNVANGMPVCYGINPITHHFDWSALMSENHSDYHSYVLCPPPSAVDGVMYFYSDDDWIIGINTVSGARTYALNLNQALYDKDNPNQIMEGGFLVDSAHHIFVMDNKYIYCLQMNE